MKQKIFLWFCFIGMTLVAVAQPINEDLPVVTNSIALINARVVTTAGKPAVSSTVLIRDGLITHVGQNISIPADAYRIKADSLYVYPAFIDAFSSIGIKESEGETQSGPGGPGGSRNTRPAVDSEGNASLEDAGITPFRSVRSMLDAKEKSIADWRSKGFAIAHVMPKGKLIPGKSALLVLTGKDVDQLLWKEDIAMFSQWIGAGNSYPGTIIGMIAKWRELYTNAMQNVAHEKMYAENASVPRAEYNQAHEALGPVVKKEMPVFFRAPKVKDITRALDLKEDLGMKMVIADAEEAWLIKERFKSTSTPLILSLALPEDKSAAKKEKDEKPSSVPAPDSTKTIEGEKQEPDPEKIAFEKRRLESLIAHRAQASIIAKEKIPFSFGTMSVKSADFFKNIQLMIDQGLTHDQALASLTIEPAKLLAIDKKCGTIEAGKMANILVSNKPIFEKDASIRYMIVEGDLYEYEIKEQKKKVGKEKGSSTASPVAGKWTFVIEAPDKKREGYLEFIEADGKFSGTITSPDITTGNNELENIVWDDKTLSFSFDWDINGQIYEAEFDLTIEDEQYSGTVAAEDIGSFPITGERVSKPEKK